MQWWQGHLLHFRIWATEQLTDAMTARTPPRGLQKLIGCRAKLSIAIQQIQPSIYEASHQADLLWGLHCRLIQKLEAPLPSIASTQPCTEGARDLLRHAEMMMIWSPKRSADRHPPVQYLRKQMNCNCRDTPTWHLLPFPVKKCTVTVYTTSEFSYHFGIPEPIAFDSEVPVIMQILCLGVLLSS